MWLFMLSLTMALVEESRGDDLVFVLLTGLLGIEMVW
jgi:hypothetical protein